MPFFILNVFIEENDFTCLGVYFSNLYYFIYFLYMFSLYVFWISNVLLYVFLREYKVTSVFPILHTFCERFFIANFIAHFGHFPTGLSQHWVRNIIFLPFVVWTAYNNVQCCVFSGIRAWIIVFGRQVNHSILFAQFCIKMYKYIYYSRLFLTFSSLYNSFKATCQ